MILHTIGVLGMGVMGSNLALNMADHGYDVAVYNHTPQTTRQFVRMNPHEHITAYYDLATYIQSLERPRKVMFMIKAGEPVDTMIDKILPYLEAGDILIDGGNSYFKDTQRRVKHCQEQGIHFIGLGISGGEKGARRGPAIMIGGAKEAYEEIHAIYNDIAAKAPDGKPCCAYMGPDGAGHFVKMVHNGIEYADMQLIAEAYLLLKYVGAYDNRNLGNIFHQWNQGELHSYLIGISADIFAETDENHKFVLDYIVDKAEQKGTGRWTCLEGIEEGVDISLIMAACNARVLSQAVEREKAKQIYPSGDITVQHTDAFIEAVRRSLYAAKIVAYAQGFSLYKQASQVYHWQLPYQRIAEIFRAGCIIQADFLSTISQAYEGDSQLDNLLFYPFFIDHLKAGEAALRHVVAIGIASGIPMPAFTNAITYIDAYRSPCMGANLIQGLRDYFGAHTFQRIDQEGAVHHLWQEHYKK